MNGADPKAGLEEEARAWAAEHAEEAPAPPPPASASSASGAPPPSSPPAPEPAEEPSDTALSMEEVAEFGVAAIDFGIQNFVSARCAFKPEQKAHLVTLGSKVLEKWLPDIGGAVEPEYAFVGAVALFAFANYKSSEPPKAKASPAGGGRAEDGSGGVPTSATVDGKPADARVLQ